MPGRLHRTWPLCRLVMIPGNPAIHTTPDVRVWVAAPDSRVRLELLLLRGSQLNQIEICLTTLSTRRGARASDAAYETRATRIARLIRHWNRAARPFGGENIPGEKGLGPGTERVGESGPRIHVVPLSPAETRKSGGPLQPTATFAR